VLFYVRTKRNTLCCLQKNWLVFTDWITQR